MATQLLNLPINIPWKQIAVSPDMMDTRFGNKRFPFAWRSSLAISAYEPKQEDLPEELCNERITYLKITCSITGYQPSAEETRIGIASFSDLPEEEQARIQRILEEESYFACYSVLLNVAVFPLNPLALPSQPKIELKDYPHIIALEPKMRDFYQAATDTNEILTASNSRVSTDKTFSHTESSETGISISGGRNTGTEGGATFSAGLTHKWGETDQDSSSLQTDASRERRETQGTTTQLSQMYNLLSGYHQGTNRATFLMLPRPNMLQPTDHRTFVQGLRQIEGIQEFMIIVSRPEKILGLCIEAFLETGHFPEDAAPQEIEVNYQRKHKDFEVPAIKVGHTGGVRPRATKHFQITRKGFEIDGWEFDPEAGIVGLGGIEQLEKLSDDNADGDTGCSNSHPCMPALEDYSYGAESPDLVTLTGTIRSYVDNDTIFHRKFRVHLRKSLSNSPRLDILLEKLLITSRGLQVCIQSGEQCPEVVKPIDHQIDNDVFVESIVDERPVRLPPSLLTSEATSASRTPAMKELLREVQKAMAGGWRLPSRYPAGEVGFLDTEYFKKRVMKVLPRERLEMPLVNVEGLPDEVIKSLGEEITLSKALEMNLGALAKKAGLSLADAVKTRRILLGIRSGQKGYENKG